MTTPRHLNYDSLEAWAEGERLPKDWTRHPDTKQTDLWWSQFAELKQHLWAKHLATLPEQEQKEFSEGIHPSQSHKFQERALPFTAALMDELGEQGYRAEVRLGLYHCDRLVLSARLDRTPPGGLLGVPSLFRGFEVKYKFPDATKQKPL